MGTKPRKTGRPRVPNPRRHMVHMRLTDAERDLIERAASQVDKFPGEWARDIVVARAREAVAL